MNATVLDTLSEKEIIRHQEKVKYTRSLLSLDEPAYERIINQLESFQVAVPSWALGTGGTALADSRQGENRGTWRKKLRMSG